MMLTRRFLLISSFVSFIMMISHSTFGQNLERMEEVIESFVPERFMGSVLVVQDDTTILDKAYGYASLEWDIENTVETKFRLGSITKQFTAVSILMLEEKGLLSTDDLIRDHIDDLPDSWSEITLHHLLTHTSGIQNATELPGFVASMPLPTSPEAQLLLYKDLPLNFEVGAEFRYSNSGYLLLGLLIENISGGSFAEFVSENIFVPLGMLDSGYDSYEELIPKRASGYRNGPDGMNNALFIDMSIPHAAGALYSTSEDLLRWNKGLFAGELISDASLQKMTTPNLGNYALGVFVTTEYEQQRVAHDGGINGFNTSMIYYPEEALSIVVLSNVNGPAGSLAVHLDKLVHGEEVVLQNERIEVSLSNEILEKYLGAYELTANFILTTSIENGQLMMQATGQQKLALFAEAENKFFMKAVDAQIDFDVDQNGEVTGLVLHQNGQDMTASRTEVPVQTERLEISLEENILQQYIGAYALAPNFILTISLEDGQLMSQATGQAKVPIFAESETRFFLKVVDAQIDFEINDDGSVTGLMLHQGGRDISAARQ